MYLRPESDTYTSLFTQIPKTNPFPSDFNVFSKREKWQADQIY